MKIITVEEHFDTPANVKNFNQYSKVKNNNPRQNELNHDLTSLQAHVDYMDKYNIDMQVISDAGNSPQVLPDNMVVSASKEQNDTLANNMTKFPKRFAGLAVLPVNLPEKAATELERSVKELGLKGGIISGSVNGQFLDDPKFEPIFAKAAELDVPLYLHPGIITDEQLNMSYKNKSYSPLLTTMMGGAAWGWHNEEGIQVVRLILGGIFEKYPKLKLITGHWGEFVPMFIERLDQFGAIGGLKKPFSETYRKNIFITPSGMFTNPQLQLIKTEMGTDHMMYSEDYPYVKRENDVRKFITEADLTNPEKEAFAHGTAEKLFKL